MLLSRPSGFCWPSASAVDRQAFRLRSRRVASPVTSQGHQAGQELPRMCSFCSTLSPPRTQSTTLFEVKGPTWPCTTVRCSNVTQPYGVGVHRAAFRYARRPSPAWPLSIRKAPANTARSNECQCDTRSALEASGSENRTARLGGAPMDAVEAAGSVRAGFEAGSTASLSFPLAGRRVGRSREPPDASPAMSPGHRAARARPLQGSSSAFVVISASTLTSQSRV
jgi:hypothetical protein